jgi:hypothetical protein
LLHASGIGAGIINRIKLPLIRRRGLPQQLVDDMNELSETIGSLSRQPCRLTEHRCVPAAATSADAKRKPTAGDVIEGNEFFGKWYRVTEVGRGDKRTEANSLGDHGCRR